MYTRLVRNNKYYEQGTKFIGFNNNIENLSITKRYNDFLDSYDYANEDWFLFCHEDWELKENLDVKLIDIDKHKFYGPIGVTKENIFIKPKLAGTIAQSYKDGSGFKIIGDNKYINREIATFDCQCLIVHSSMINKYKLRFDTNLSFDLYVEDFCINGKEKFGIKSKILPIKCQHYSEGKIGGRFMQQLDYLKKKYSNIKDIYGSTVSGVIISSKNRILIHKITSKLLSFFYEKKLKNNGILKIKICKIPVYVTKRK